MKFKKENIKEQKIKGRKIKNLKTDTMTENDIKYRQGRSKRQVESNEQVMFYGSVGFAVVLAVMIIYGLVTNG